jgi:D-lactate dehydrogenase (cytochrome)
MVDTDDATEVKEVKAFMERLTKRALEMGGTCTGEHGVGQGKVKYLLAEHGAPALHAMRAVKQALDPDNIMNPSKMLPAD